MKNVTSGVSYIGRALRLAVMVALTATAAPAMADEAPPAVGPPVGKEQMTEARRQFEAGVSLLEDPDGARYEEAYNAFRRAHELARSPKILGNIAFCAFHLERDGEAIDLYTTYLRDVVDIDPRERSQIERDLATLNATIATVTIRVKGAPEGPLTLVDRRTPTRGNPVENTYPVSGAQLTLRLRAGRRVLRVKTTETESLPLETSVASGSTSTHELTFRPASALSFTANEAPPGRRSVAGPIVLGVTGALGVGAGVVTGLLARGTTKDIEDRCPNDICPTAYTDFTSDRRSAKTLATVADISFIGGGALLGSALLWYALTPSRSARRTTAIAPQAMCAASGCRLGLEGAF